MADKLIVGIAVSEDWLDLCASDAAGVERIVNTSDAVVAWLERVAPGLIACEPTGGDERTLIAALRERGLAFVRVHPNEVIAFRKSRGHQGQDRRHRRPADLGVRARQGGPRRNAHQLAAESGNACFQLAAQLGDIPFGGELGAFHRLLHDRDYASACGSANPASRSRFAALSVSMAIAPHCRPRRC